MSLINFRKHDFNDDIKLFHNVYFNKDKWWIQWSQSEHESYNFSSVELGQTYLSDYPELCRFAKIMTYYSFPNLIQLSISSWATTSQYFFGIKTFICNFVWPNQLLSAKMLSNITKEQLVKYRDEVIGRLEIRAYGSIAEYRSFTAFIKMWSNLTARNLLPNEYKLSVNIGHILPKDVSARAYYLTTELIKPWQPMCADDIEACYSDAYKYVKEYASSIIECDNLVQRRGRNTLSALRSVRKDGQTKEVFKALLKFESPYIDKHTKLFNFTPVTRKEKRKGYKRGWQYRTYINIQEIRPKIIHLKRACIFLIALFTGMRRREIAELKARTTYTKNGSLYLRITRFKTSDDPSGLGEPDEIPVPEIVSDAIDTLIVLLEKQRNELDSDYLLLSDIVSKKRYEKIKIVTVSQDIREYTCKITGVESHAHQLRKTLAWLLISRSEKNVELIRQLFGHKSYGMTLKYILRNELLVESVVEIITTNFTQDLSEALQSIADGETVGDLSQKIRQRIDSPKYKGQILATDVESFVNEAIKAGMPVFVSKLPIGGFCIRAGDTQSIPPCMMKSKSKTPNVAFCDYKNCNHVLHNGDSVSNINKQVAYYQNKLKYLIEDSNKELVAYYNKQISENQELLERLQTIPFEKQAASEDSVYA